MATQLAPVDDEPVEQQAGTEDTPQTRDFDAEARSHGWLPREEFKGDPAKWSDAETFIRRADTQMPLLRKKVHDQDRKIAQLERVIKQSSEHFSKAEERAYARAVADLKAKQEDAVETGDVAAFRALDKQIDALKVEVAPAPAQTPVSDDDVREAWSDWREANVWYDKGALASATPAEAEARILADQLSERHVSKTKTMPPDEFFAFIGGEVEKRLGEKLKAPAPARRPSQVAGVGQRSPGGGAQSFGNLPAEAQAQADRFFKMGVIKAKDLAEARVKYCATYDWNGK